MAKRAPHALDVFNFSGPALQRTLHLVCETGSPRDACNLLRTCKWMRTAAQQSCAGLVPVECSSTPQQASTVAAWLKHNPLLARSLSIKFPGRWDFPPKSEDRQAMLSTLAQALQTSASICRISSCCLLFAGPECVEILHQLPSRQLTSLQLSLWQPSNALGVGAPWSHDRKQNIATALLQLQQLESVELSFSQSAADHIDGLDCLLTSVSKLSKLTSLKLTGVISNAELQHLPTHLKELDIGLHRHLLECVLLDHLTQLTKLVLSGSSRLSSSSTVPPSLEQLDIGYFKTASATLTRLSRLQDLSLNFCTTNNEGAATLAQLSKLRALTSVKLHYEGHGIPSSLEATTCIWERLPVRTLCIITWGDPLPPSVLHMTCLKQLTELHLADVDFLETTHEQFAAALKQLTTLQRLDLMAVNYQASNSAELTHNGDSVQGHLGTATTQGEHADAVDPATVAAIFATLGFEHVAKAIASLPNLHTLHLEQQPITPRVAQHLGACRGKVKELGLIECSLTNASLGPILVGLCDVKVLDVSFNPDLDDQVLLLMRDHLNYVEDYMFDETNITRKGVKCFLPDYDAFVDKGDTMDPDHIGSRPVMHYITHKFVVQGA